MGKEKPLIAVLTGDVIKSSRLTAAGIDVPAMLREAHAATRQAFPESLHPAGIAVFRGDSWQFVVSDVARSFRIAIFFRAFLKSRNRKLDSRIAIAVDTCTRINQDNVSESSGVAFTVSGRLLDEIARSTRPKQPTFTARMPDDQYRLQFDAPLVLVGAIIGGWTQKQAKAVCGVLKGLSHDAIAASWRPQVSRNAISKHLNSARWSEIEYGLELIETDFFEHFYM